MVGKGEKNVDLSFRISSNKWHPFLIDNTALHGFANKTAPGVSEGNLRTENELLEVYKNLADLHGRQTESAILNF